MQTGGSFDIDYEVKDPQQKVILDGEKERQGDFVFTAQHAGEYSFCFSNDMSTFAEKIVDFEITVLPSPPRLPRNHDPRWGGKGFWMDTDVGWVDRWNTSREHSYLSKLLHRQRILITSTTPSVNFRDNCPPYVPPPPLFPPVLSVIDYSTHAKVFPHAGEP